VRSVGYKPSLSGRSAARATVGGEFPTGTLSVVPRVPSSPLVHVSASPPLIPDGRLSRVRLAASDVWVLSRRSLPLRHGGLSAHSHTPLIRLVYCTASQRLRLPPASSTESRVVSPTWPSLYREPLRLVGGLPRRGSCSHDLDQHYPALVATPGSCARPPPSHALRSMAWSVNLCRVPRAPAGKRSFPMLSPQSLWRGLDPYPAAPLRCPYPFLPAELRPHLTCKRFGALRLPP
jgi:hypothetical protein